MNKEGLALLATVISRDASLADAVKKGDCKVIAAGVNGYMPKDMQITPVDVFQALSVHVPGFALPKHNAAVLRARIDKVPVLYSARLTQHYQTIVNELNLSPDPAEHVTLNDVKAAMDLRVEPAPKNPVAAALSGVPGAG